MYIQIARRIIGTRKFGFEMLHGGFLMRASGNYINRIGHFDRLYIQRLAVDRIDDRPQQRVCRCARARATDSVAVALADNQM